MWADSDGIVVQTKHTGNLVADSRNVESQRRTGRGVATHRRLGEVSSIEEFLHGDIPILGNRDSPAFPHHDVIQSNTLENPISIVTGETGTGKTTETIQYLIELGYKVYSLQPRRAVANALYGYVSSQLVDQLGPGADQLVGLRHSQATINTKAPLQIMTPGTALRIMSEIKYMAETRPTVLIHDEVHEKNFDPDLGSAHIADMIALGNTSVRLMLVSATMKVEDLQKTYAIVSDDVPVVDIKGRPQNVEWHERPDDSVIDVLQDSLPDYLKHLIFVEGKAEIKDVMDQIRRRNLGNLALFGVHARMPGAEIARILNTMPTPERPVVIVGTNCLISGVTIPGLGNVITTGEHRTKFYDDNNVPGLDLVETSRFDLTQQAGRAARDELGFGQSSDGRFTIAKPLSGRSYVSLEDREEQGLAEIYGTNIATNTLLTARSGWSLLEANEYLQNKIDPLRIHQANETLRRLGALDESNIITELGKRIAELPLRPEFGRAVMAAVDSGASTTRLYQLIAMLAAVENNGIQSYVQKASTEWKEAVSEDVMDDYARQVDLFRATNGFYDERTDTLNERSLSAKGYDTLSTDRAHAVFGKVCQRLGLSNPRHSVQALRQGDMEELRGYLLSGTFDSTYRYIRTEKGKDRNRHFYRSVLESGDEDAKEFYISDRSCLKIDDTPPQYVVGSAHRFMKKSSGKANEHHVLEHVFPLADPQALVPYVRNFARYSAHDKAVLQNGRMSQRVDMYFGDIKLGEHDQAEQFVHTESSKKLLISAALATPGLQAIAQIKQVKRQLEELQRRAYTSMHKDYFPRGIMTQDWIEAQLKDLIIPGMRTVYDLDSAVQQFAIETDTMTLESWVTPEVQQAIEEASPALVILDNGSIYEVNYTRDIPIVSRFNLTDLEVLGEAWSLPDGREIKINFPRRNGDIRRFTVSTLRQHISQGE